MSILAFAAAGLMVAPLPSVDQARRIQRDYPTEAVRDDKSAASLIRIAVGPTGKIYRCDTLSVVGDADLGKAACRTYLRGKLEFAPAANADGGPTYGLITTVIAYFLPGTRQGREVAAVKQAPDLALTVASLPVQHGSLLEFAVYAEVSAGGKVTACEGPEAAPQDYAGLACRAITGSQLSMLTDEDGRPVPYVTSLKVQFATAAVED